MSLLKIKNYIFKNFLKPIILFGLTFLFKEPIELSINKLVNLASIDKFDALYTKELFLLFILIIVISLKLSRKIGDFTHLVPYYVFFIIWYLTYRLDSNGFWSFESLKLTKNIKYLDVIFLEFLVILVPIRKRKQSELPNTLFEDLPIFESENDKLGYVTYAKEIAKKLTTNNFQKAFAIGVNGKWGSGKTSFIKLIEKELDDSDFIKISFNPWASKNPEAITQDFFEELEETLIENNYLFGNLVSSYAGKILNNNSSNWVKSLLPFFAKTESFSTVQKRLEKTLFSLDKKILIVIDDIDRLDSKEIFEVLKIIRNTANFKNIIYLLGYDKEYVNEKILTDRNGLMSSYLEKIIQLEVFLPYYDKKTLMEAFNSNLIKIIDSFIKEFPEKEEKKCNYLNNIKTQIENGVIFIPKDLPLIENLRDITRLSNSVLINWKNVIGEVEPYEFFTLEILRIKEPSIYEILKSSEKHFISILNGNYLGLTSSGVLKQRIEQYCKNNYDGLSLQQNKISGVDKILSELFGEINVALENIKNKNYNSDLSIRRPTRFNLYFYYYIPNNIIPYFELLNHRENKEFEKFDEIINNKVKEGLEQEILKYFQKINDFNDFSDFEGILKSIIKYGKLSFLNNTNENIDSKDFFDKILSGYIQFILKSDINRLNNFFESNENRNDFKLKDFIIKYLTPTTYDKSVLFESFQLESTIKILDMYMYSQVLIEDLRKHQITILKGYSETINSINSIAIRIFRNTNKGPDSKNEIYLESAQEIMRNLIKKDLKVFLQSIFETDGRNTSTKYLNSNFLTFFNFNWENFESFMHRNNNNEAYFEEFIKFFEKFKANGYTSVEGFKFKNLQFENNRLTY